ncbi:MAG: hypothetical protein RLZZ437_2279 [Pseudomonadota bacterium]|jgi:hypothetical protein
MLHNLDIVVPPSAENTLNPPQFRRKRRRQLTKGNVEQGAQMQVFRPIDYVPATLVGRGFKVMLAGADAQSTVAGKLARLGGEVEAEVEGFMALGAVMDDPQGYGLFVINTEGVGGDEAAQRICALLKGAYPRLPVIIVGGQSAEQTFPEEVVEPVRLRAPVSAVSLRVGFEHAMRERMMWNHG